MNRSREPADEDLVRELLAGSTDALAELFRRHRDAVYACAYRITGVTQEAEDVLQDVFVGLRRALQRYVERGTFEAWLGGVTTRVALMRLRSRRRGAVDPAAQARDVAAPAGADPIDRLAVRSVLASMPDAQRLVFVLKEIEGYSHEEIAELLGIRVGASKVRLHRAWRFLQRRLGRAG